MDQCCSTIQDSVDDRGRKSRQMNPLVLKRQKVHQVIPYLFALRGQNISNEAQTKGETSYMNYFHCRYRSGATDKECILSRHKYDNHKNEILANQQTQHTAGCSFS